MCGTSTVMGHIKILRTFKRCGKLPPERFQFVRAGVYMFFLGIAWGTLIGLIIGLILGLAW
jgi:hypothetical protein